MSRFRSLPRRRTAFLALAVVAVVAALLLASARHAAALVCPQGWYHSVNVIYYNDADHDKQVGEYYGCSGDLVGQSTDHYIDIQICCPGT